uniref:(northern house mosquito) hypothetical protein n=1 Tax=Culex pipiens TaxID=7175 RepID=A0A8D8A5L6_CULPI
MKLLIMKLVLENLHTIWQWKVLRNGNEIFNFKTNFPTDLVFTSKKKSYQYIYYLIFVNIAMQSHICLFNILTKFRSLSQRMHSNLLAVTTQQRSSKNKREVEREERERKCLCAG